MKVLTFALINSLLFEEVLGQVILLRSSIHNAVAKATFKSSNLAALKLQPADYVNWFNNHRIHSSLGYLTTVKYRMNTLKKFVKNC